MRKLGLYTLVLMIGVGMVVMGGCGGGDSAAPGTLPQSAASYMGSNMPANIDTSTGSNYHDLYNQLFNSEGVVRTSSSGGQQLSGNSTVEGDIGGTATITWSTNITYGPTGSTTTGSNTFVYDNWENSGDGEPNYVMRGSGSRFNEYAYNENYDGVVPEEPAPPANGSGVGTYLGAERMDYVNFSDFAESTSDMDPYYDPYDELTAGWSSQKYSYLETTGAWSGNHDANIAYNNFTDEEYFGLLNSTAAADYDGSVSTLVAAGRLCEEGFGIGGCLDYEMDLLWDGDEDPEVTDVLPDDGTMNISTDDSSAMYDYGYDSDPDCYLYSLDADNDSAYEYTIVECEIP